jgi:hypothetical protein
MLLKKLAFIVAIFASTPIAIFAVTPKDQAQPVDNVVQEEQVIEAQVTVNAVYGSNKKIEQIVAVAKVPLAQVGKLHNGRRRTGYATVTVTEAANGKRKLARRNIDTSSELYQRLIETLNDSIVYYKEHHKGEIAKFKKKISKGHKK